MARPWWIGAQLVRSATDGLRRGSDRVADPLRREVRQTTIALDAGIEIDPELRGHLRVPHRQIERLESGRTRERLSGVGDASVWFEWWPDGDRPQRRSIAEGGDWTFLSGLELPTGAARSDLNRRAIPPSLMQLGSGTYDPFAGAAWSATEGEWRLRAASLVRIPINSSGAGLNPGNSLALQAGADRSLFGSVEAGATLEARWMGREWLGGRKLRDTGSSLLAAAPRLAAQLGADAWIEGTAWLPMQVQANGVQIAPGPAFEVRIGLHF
ncbi:MAG TPA: hypothetical protein VGC54_13460 [Planctomycetota bacterium]